MKYLSLILLSSLILLGCEKEPTRQEVLGQMTKEYLDAVRNLTSYKEYMEDARHNAQQNEEAIKYLSECLKNAPEGNHAAVMKLSSDITELEKAMSHAWGKHSEHKQKYRNAEFIILNYGEGSCIRNALDTVSVDIVKN